MVFRTTETSGDDIVGKDDKLAAMAQEKRSRFDQSYGAMTMIMGYLPQIEQLRLQGLDTWWYTIGVGRVQVDLETGKMFYFVFSREPQIIAVN